MFDFEACSKIVAFTSGVYSVHKSKCLSTESFENLGTTVLGKGKVFPCPPFADFGGPRAQRVKGGRGLDGK